MEDECLLFSLTLPSPLPPPEATPPGVFIMGDADSLQYSDLKEEDVEAVIDFMAEHFYPREPLVSTDASLLRLKSKPYPYFVQVEE